MRDATLYIACAALGAPLGAALAIGIWYVVMVQIVAPLAAALNALAAL